MNRKGFAVTAVIYGLSILGILIITILMGTLSSSRNNVSEEAKRIEKELIAYNKSSVIYTTGQYYFTVPEGETGWYRIEAYGRSMITAKGAFVTGIIYLEEGRTLYVNIPNDGTSIINAGGPEGPEILRVAGGFGEIPGGTTKVQCQEAAGGDIDLTTSLLKDMTNINVLGSKDVSYKEANCVGARTSYLSGYPGSGPKASYGGFDYYFVDGFMMPSAHEGVGKIVIQLLSKKDDENPTIPRANTKYDNVKGMRVINHSGVSIVNMNVTAGGSEIFSYSGDTGTANMNQTYSFNCSACKVDDISIEFNTTNNPYVNNVELKLIKEDNQEVTIYKAAGTNGGFTATPTGIKLSAYQPDSLQELPNHGNYYIIPVVNNQKVVSARKDSETDSNPIGIESINGDARQRWGIEVITNPNVVIPGVKEYHLTETSRFKAMAIFKDENRVNNRVAASMTFNTLSRNKPQIWKIVPVGDGTFAIKSSVESYYSNKRTGFLTVNTGRNEDGTVPDYYEQVMIGFAENLTAASDDVTTPTLVEKFTLYALDFSHTK